MLLLALCFLRSQRGPYFSGKDSRKGIFGWLLWAVPAGFALRVCGRCSGRGSRVCVLGITCSFPSEQLRA